jgi:hypothetical protein
MELIFVFFWLLRCRILNHTLRFKWSIDETDENADEAKCIEFQETEAVPLILCIYRLERVIVADMLKANAGRCLYESTTHMLGGV